MLLFEHSPHLRNEWDYSLNICDPEILTHGSDRKFWWKCSKNHPSYLSSISHKSINNRGCPYCSGKLPVPGINDLNTTHPQLSKELLDYSISFNYKKHSHKLVDWKCLVHPGCTWKSTIANRAIRGNGCPYCAGKIPVKGFNDLETTHSHLCEELVDQSLKNIVSSGSSKTVEWRCSSCQHLWKTSPKHRAGGTGCPSCASYGFNSGAEAYLYLMYNTELGLVKIGVTGTNTKRIQSFSIHGWRLHKLIKFSKGSEALIIERNILDSLRNQGIFHVAKQFKWPYGGHTEMFESNRVSLDFLESLVESSFLS